MSYVLRINDLAKEIKKRKLDYIKNRGVSLEEAVKNYHQINKSE